MLAIYLAPLYILVNIYVVRWLILWMGACSRHFKKTWIRGVVILIYIFFASALLTGFLFPYGRPERFMKLVGNYWLGVMAYIILTIVTVDIARIILRKLRFINQEKLRSRKTFVLTGTLCVLIISTVSAWGAMNARIVRTTDYKVTIDKKVEGISDLNVVLAADLHLGYNIGCRQMQRMVDKINLEDADLVVIAGDIFDNSYESLDDPDRLVSILKSIKSTYGVYACYGNHDIREKILAGFTFSKKEEKKVSDIRMDELLKKADITLLQDEGVLIDDRFYLYGRPDYQKPGRGIDERKTPKEITADMDQSKPVIVIDHQPRELKELADAGVDLDLCGHTHDGQMFPGNLTIKLLWENPCGYMKKGEMHNIVTSGVGLFGPNMRVGTKAEICSINVQFGSGRQ